MENSTEIETDLYKSGSIETRKPDHTFPDDKKMEEAFALPEYDYSPDENDINNGTRDWLDVVLAVLITPFQMYRKNLKYINYEFYICLCCFVLGIVPGIFYYFYKDTVRTKVNLGCLLVAPLGYWLDINRVNRIFWICLGIYGAFFVVVVLTMVYPRWWMFLFWYVFGNVNLIWAYKHIY